MKKYSILAIFLVLTLAIGSYSYLFLFNGLPVFQLGGKTVVAEVSALLPTKEEGKLSFKARLLEGENKADEVEAVQNKGEAFILAKMQDAVQVGDKVILEMVPTNELGSLLNDKGEFDEENFDALVLWRFLDYYRLSPIYLLAGLFALGLVLIGQKKGFMTLVSLVLTIFMLFFFFIPWVLHEKSIYLGLGFSLFYIVTMSILLIAGASKKAFVTITSTFIGLFCAFLVSYLASSALHLTGYLNEESIYLANLSRNGGIDLIALGFSAILIGALGAVMDMAMDISSALYELSQEASHLTRASLIKSGFKIGTDVMGTMSNTLILAYIGSGLMGFMLLLAYSHSLNHLLSRELIALELLQALSGSLALLVTIPTTVVLASFIYYKEKKDA